MWRFLSWVGLIVCFIGLLFSGAIVAHLVISPPHGPVAIVAIVVMLISAILLLPPILGVCALLRPAGLLGADPGRKTVRCPLPEEKIPRAAKVTSRPAGAHPPADAAAEALAQPPKTPKKKNWPFVFAITASVVLFGIRAVFRISFIELVGLQVTVAGVYVLLLRRHAMLLRRRRSGDAAPPDAAVPVLPASRYWLAFGMIAIPFALAALAIGQDREVRPAVFVVAPLLIVAGALWVGLSARISRRVADARARGAEPDAAAQKRDARAMAAASAMFAVGVIGSFLGLYAHARSVELRRAPFIRSEVFHALPGCPTSGAGLTVLPKSCDDPRYRIASAPDAFGLPIPASKYAVWLRIGPDAALVNHCNLQTCPIQEVRTGVFVTHAVTP